MPDIPIPPRWYCLRPPKRRPEGPFDLQQLAALLHTGDISGQTLTQREGPGVSPWIPFRERPEFVLARQVPLQEIEQHLKDLAAEETPPWWTPRRLSYLAEFIFGMFTSGRGNNGPAPF